ncbi:MAG: class I SAM-dependent methyltransferase [Deltaproteobacteria bacterium]|nr:class I SAM-dependent methyltransferase [Deltaproteobacteria bacterium]
MSKGNNYQLEKTSKFYLKNKTKFSKDLFSKIFTFLRKDDIIVEIGPGLGHFAKETRIHGLEYIGFEPSKVLREKLQKNNINVRDEFIPPIPLENDCCDLVYASMILEHLPTHTKASEFSLEIARVLKKGGHVCLIVPNYLTSKEFFFEMDYTHSFVTTKRRVTNLLRDAELQLVEVQHVIGWFWVKSGFFHHILRHLINTLMVPVHFGVTTWFFEYIGLETLLWKIRKTFFESLIIVAKK